MSEESHENQKPSTTVTVITGIALAITLLGCCVAGVVIAAIGFLIPTRVVTVSQVTSGPILIATPSPTPVFMLPLDTQPPAPPLATEAQADTPTTIAPTESLAQAGTVVKIIDGDTIDVNIDGEVLRVRYIGINTPERDQQCGSEATAANQALVDGHQVNLVKDVSETDKYGRLLRYVYVGEIFINAELVRNGWAEAVTYPPDTNYADMFRGLQDRAREANVGCWPSGVWEEMP